MALPVNKLTKADIILIAGILLFSVISIMSITFLTPGNADGFEIRVDGKLHSTYLFSDLKDREYIEIKTEYGYNIFLYENKSIKCVETDCLDKTEIKSGPISKTNQILICLPHKLTVQITGQNPVDTVSY